jgi:hypothetical protein
MKKARLPSREAVEFKEECHWRDAHDPVNEAICSRKALFPATEIRANPGVFPLRT